MDKKEAFKMLKIVNDVYVQVIINEDQVVSFKVSKKEAKDVIMYQAVDELDVRVSIIFGNMYIG